MLEVALEQHGAFSLSSPITARSLGNKHSVQASILFLPNPISFLLILVRVRIHWCGKSLIPRVLLIVWVRDILAVLVTWVKRCKAELARS